MDDAASRRASPAPAGSGSMPLSPCSSWSRSAWSVAWFVIRDRVARGPRRWPAGGGAGRAAMDLPGPGASAAIRSASRCPAPASALRRGRRHGLARAGRIGRAGLSAPLRHHRDRRAPDGVDGTAASSCRRTGASSRRACAPRRPACSGRPSSSRSRASRVDRCGAGRDRASRRERLEVACAAQSRPAAGRRPSTRRSRARQARTAAPRRPPRRRRAARCRRSTSPRRRREGFAGGPSPQELERWREAGGKLDVLALSLDQGRAAGRGEGRAAPRRRCTGRRASSRSRPPASTGFSPTSPATGPAAALLGALFGRPIAGGWRRRQPALRRCRRSASTTAGVALGPFVVPGVRLLPLY